MSNQPVARIPAASIISLDQVTKSIGISRRELVTPTTSIRIPSIYNHSGNWLGDANIIYSGAFTILHLQAITSLDAVSLNLELEILADYHSCTCRFIGNEVELVRTLVNPVSNEELAAQIILAMGALGEDDIVGA